MSIIFLNIQTKITQGKWRVDLGFADSIELYGDDYLPVCSIELDDHGAEPTEEQRANAHLLSFAPEMLTMLHGAHLALQSYAYGNESHELASEYLAHIKNLLEEIDAPYRIRRM